MKRSFLTSILCVAVISVTSFAAAQKQVSISKKGVLLKMQGDEGTNSGGLAWNPTKQFYYASFAGNATYPFETFTKQGTHKATTTAGFDVRGLWWNSNLGHLEGNGYDDYGWWTIELKADGCPSGAEEIQSGVLSPDAQSVGTYDPATNEVIYFYDGSIIFYDRKSKEETDAAELQLSSDIGDYNYTSVIFTGVPGKEYGILNVNSNRVELYNREGVCTALLQLPDDAVTSSAFSFAYANKQIFLFDVEARTWQGYKAKF